MAGEDTFADIRDAMLRRPETQRQIKIAQLVIAEYDASVDAWEAARAADENYDGPMVLMPTDAYDVKVAYGPLKDVTSSDH